MAETLSLSELKAQNAQTEETETEEIEEVLEEEVEAELETEDETEEEVETEDEGELELWQKKEDESEDGKVIDHSGWKKQRLKTKALKAENREKDEKLEALQLEVERLKSGNQVAASEAPPTLEEHDFDEAKYQAAVASYFAKQVDSKLQSHSQAQSQENQLKEIAKQTERSVDEHYDRAQKLIDSGKITEEVFVNADRNIRETLDSISNGNGDVFADQLISQLNNSGEGSEKVWTYLGNNKSAINKLVDSFNRDPSGIQAAIYLGNLQQKATTPIRKKRSDAPKPAPTIKGSSSKKMSAAQKAYDKLESSQDRISAKRKAKAEGIDTSKW